MENIETVSINTEWLPLGTGIAGIVNAIAFDSQGNLYAGGDFTAAGGTPALRLAVWNGTSWSAFGSGVYGLVGDNPQIYSILTVGQKLYVAGRFTSIDGVSANSIAVYE
ncbi:MAG: hypothetical protein HQM10_14330 [Candidatus Riflebacteria bacterium]|nr:hypothetical protein [Candidatus Riflebacteria bacterium]